MQPATYYCSAWCGAGPLVHAAYQATSRSHDHRQAGRAPINPLPISLPQLRISQSLAVRCCPRERLLCWRSAHEAPSSSWDYVADSLIMAVQSPTPAQARAAAWSNTRASHHRAARHWSAGRHAPRTSAPPPPAQQSHCWVPPTELQQQPLTPWLKRAAPTPAASTATAAGPATPASPRTSASGRRFTRQPLRLAPIMACCSTVSGSSVLLVALCSRRLVQPQRAVERV